MANFITVLSQLVHKAKSVVQEHDFAKHAFKVVVTEYSPNGEVRDTTIVLLARDINDAYFRARDNYVPAHRKGFITDIVITRLMRSNPAAEEAFYSNTNNPSS